MANLWGKTYTRLDLLRRTGDIAQLAAAQPFELAEGVERGSRGVWLRNAGKLELCAIAERGLSITHLAYQGVPIPFTSAAGATQPAYHEPQGKGWLRSWPGGFLTPCGLTQVGSPCNDEGTELGMHGRIANLPPRNLSWGGEWQGDDYCIWVQGSMAEAAVFGENLWMTRRIWTKLGEAKFWIEDQVENRGFSPAPLMFLQHINLGFPLVDAEARLELPSHTTEPRDEAAQVGIEDCLRFQEPEAGYAEQVFYHTLTPDSHGRVEVTLSNPGFDGRSGLRLALRYALSEYPVLVEWKMMGEGLYVVGLEPTNCHVGGRCQERERGTLHTLAPQEIRRFHLEFEFSKLIAC